MLSLSPTFGNASVITRRTCYGSCVSGAAAELRLKFCVSCGWLGSESDSAVTVPATHVSCGRRASDAPNRTQKIPQRRHVQRTGAMPSRYLQRAFAMSVWWCACLHLSSTALHLRHALPVRFGRPANANLMPAGKVSEEINQDFFIGWSKCVGQLRWLPRGATSPWLPVLITNHVLLSAPFISHFSCWQEHFLLLSYFGLPTFCWSWWADRFPPCLLAPLPFVLVPISSLSWR